MRTVITRLPSILVFSTLLFSTLTAQAARIEYQATRQNILPDAMVPTNLPNLSQNNFGPGNSFILTGSGSDTLSGVFEIRHNHVTPNGSALFAGLATYVGGTGIYAGASGQNVFAGIFDARTGATTVADYGFVDAPNLAGADQFLETVFGTPATTSPLEGGDMFEFSGVRKDAAFNDIGPTRIDIPVSIVNPFVLDSNVADNSGGYRMTGPEGNFVAGNYFGAASASYGDTILFAGFTFVNDGGAPQWEVTGGSGVFAGRNVRQNPGDTTGTESVTDFGYVTARRIDAPATLPLLTAGLALLALRRRALLRSAAR